MAKYPVDIPVIHPPFGHQADGLTLSHKQKVFAFFMEMGTGKTKVTIDEAMYLYLAGEIEAVVVVAPKGVYRNWVSVELPKHMGIEAFVTYWSSYQTKELEESYKELFKPLKKLKILAVNIEALSTDRGTEFVGKFVTQHKCLMVIDESTTIKNISASRTKNAIKIGKRAVYRRILSGDPVTKSPMDLFSQCWFLDPTLLGHRSFFSFRARYAVMKQQMLPGGRSFLNVTGYQRLDELQGILRGFSFRVKKEDCLDLPPKSYMFRDVELTPEQTKMYKRLKDEAYAEFEGKVVTTAMVIVKLLRLHQIVCGHFKDDMGQVIDVPTNRIDELMEVLDEASGKVVIWATYRRDIEKLQEAIGKAHGPDSLVVFHGGTADDARVHAVNAFQNHNHVRFFLGNPAAGRFGITLTAASTMVYYSNSYDLEHRIQSEDRIHRIGQHHPCTYVDLVARRTVDERIISALRSKRRVASDTLGDEWKEWLT